jgi:hypothetical protein
MKASREHLPADLKAIRYLDALDAGDLEVVSALWEEASRDPELERLLGELDGALFVEIPGNLSSRPERLGDRPAVPVLRAVALGTLAAACLLALLARPRRDIEDQGQHRHVSQTGTKVVHQTSAPTPIRGARRDLDEAAMPRFVWPLENRLSASTPLNQLD